MEKQSADIIYCQEIDLSSGQPPLSFLKQVVAEAPHASSHLEDIGMVRDGDRVLIKLYYSLSGAEED